MFRDAVDCISASIRSPKLASVKSPTWDRGFVNRDHDLRSVCPPEVLHHGWRRWIDIVCYVLVMREVQSPEASFQMICVELVRIGLDLTCSGAQKHA